MKRRRNGSMNKIRRAILRSGTALALLATGLVRPLVATAAEWNKTAFDAKTLADSIKAIGGTNAQDSKDILIKAPDIAENGAVVPVEVTSRIPNTQAIAILAEKNPFPLVASFDFAAGAEAYASTRIKLGQTSNIRVLVKTADGKFYSALKEVKVTIGGCGG
jgi:sulfur-oxidizing protein SoxY